MSDMLGQSTATHRTSRWWSGFSRNADSQQRFNKVASSRRGVVQLAREIRKAESRASSLTDMQLRDMAKRTHDVALRETAGDQSPVQWAGLIAEAVFRTHGFRLHDVQVQAMVAGATGSIVEMQTGEGKTVVTGSTAAMQLVTAQSVHVGTTNTYLAARDLEDMAATFDLLQITHGLLPEESNEALTRKVYRQQIVYGPGYQYGFDYLRDQMHLRRDRQNKLGVGVANRIRGVDPLQNLIQPELHDVALIDEADSVMIDEAMTPLIISLPGTGTDDPTPYLLAKKITADFEEGSDYSLKMPEKRLELTENASQRAHDMVASQRNLKLSRPWRVYLANAIRARQLFTRDVDYVVVEGKVQIVDQNTGRIFADRTWQDGLHQAVEAKEGLSIQPGRESTTQITRQRYLQMYNQLGGLTGTAASVAAEFGAVYRCKVIEIPTNRKSLRDVGRTRFFASLESKLDAIAEEVARRHKSGQPILVGTRTIQESHEVRDALLRKGLTPAVLNGIQDQEEADIVAMAGKFGTITIATNMAGRGTDIKPDQKSLEAGGLHVIGVSHNESRRIDRQLVGRAARQGQPGSAQFFASATDSLFEDNHSPLRKAIVRRSKSNGESSDFSRDLDRLQTAIEARNFKQRQDMILRDCWMDTVREAIEKD